MELRKDLMAWYNHQYIHNGLDKNNNYVYVKLLELQAEIERLQGESNQWVSVEDRLPDYNEAVLVNCYRERGVTWPESRFICTATLTQVTRHCGENPPLDNRWYVRPSGGHEITKDVTHWKPLPNPPKGQQQ